MKMNRKIIFDFLKNLIFGLLLAICSFLISSIICSFIFYQRINRIYQIFLTNASLTDLELRQTLETSIDRSTKIKKNLFFLILGTDLMENRTSPPLTDTMMVANLNLETNQINLLSLPRDLYLKDYKTKINSLYYYSQKRNEPNFVTDAIGKLINQKIDYTVVVSLDQIKDFIDLIGGLEIEIEHGFIDEKFPREDVNFNLEKNPKKWYKTVEFKPGPQTLNGTKALEYIRSRYSMSSEGNDISRNQRQQDIIKALPNNLFNKIYQPKTNPNLINVKLAGELWKYYQDNFNQNISITELLALGIYQFQNRNFDLKFNQSHLTIYPDQKDGLLINPPISKYEQWAYEIKNQSEFDKFIQNCFQ
jgi:LCP family protein required for cell wall assembly